VYVKADRLPGTEAFLNRMVASNPYNRPGAACVGAREGLLFTDLRFHMALARKEKNPECFRPDLSDSLLPLGPEALRALHQSTGLVVLRYAIDRPSADMRHLQFLPHAAGAVLDLCDGTAVLDRVARVFWLRDDFAGLLGRRPRVDGFDTHCRVVWERWGDGFRARTLGLRKVGRPELVTQVQEEDHESLVTGLLRQAAREAFRDPARQGPWRIEAFGDVFELAPVAATRDDQTVRIARIQAN
jgi:hypothetical protein